VIDIGSEWRTFSNEATRADPCRVGSAENTLLNGSDLSTHTEGGTCTVALDEFETQNINCGKQFPVKITIHAGKKLRGRSTNSIAPACLCIASRQEGVPQTFKEVCAVSQTSKKEIGRVFKLVQATLDISVETITTRDLMSRFCSHLGLSNTVRNAATAASKFNRLQKEIGDVAGVGEKTVRQVYRLMYSRAGELFPKDFVFSTPIDKLPVS
ncbi:Transcription initiation factor IIB, partial [Orchesella cincta]